jgi:chromosome condensin MukBEF ATPase and DNA-binding subunit MukB
MAGIDVPMERIQNVIYLIRGQKVMLDRDLAALYEVPTKVLKQAVKRHADRFPDDFMFVLERKEFMNWRSQFVTSNADRIGLRHAPMAFTEQGVAMLSSALNSSRAIQVNIAVMRAFVQLRAILSTHADLARKLEELEKKYDTQFRAVFDAIRQLMTPTNQPRKRIGFHVREKSAIYGVKEKLSRR